MLVRPDYRVQASIASERREQLIELVLRDAEVPERDFERCRETMRESFVSATFFVLYPEVEQVLSSLRKAGIRLGVVSNWEPRLPLLCRNHGLDGYFEFVLASETEGYAKPGPWLFKRALELAEVEPKLAAHVGDSFEHDVLGASQLGITAILLDRGDYYEAGRWKPTVRSLVELVELVS